MGSEMCIRDSACAEQGVNLSDDINGKEQSGARLSQVTQHKGERCSAAKAYLTPNLNRDNLTVFTHCHVKKINIKNCARQNLLLIV